MPNLPWDLLHGKIHRMAKIYKRDIVVAKNYFEWKRSNKAKQACNYVYHYAELMAEDGILMSMEGG